MKEQPKKKENEERAAGWTYIQLEYQAICDPLSKSLPKCHSKAKQENEDDGMMFAAWNDLSGT